jgi:hypothetical protein
VNPLKDPLAEISCIKNWMTVIDGCDTDTRTRKQGGDRTKDGSWWDLHVERPPTLTTKSCNKKYASAGMTSVSRTFASPQVKSLCGHDYDDPAHKGSARWYRVSGVFDSTIELDLKYAEDQTNCRSTNSIDPFFPDDCVSSLMKAIDDCELTPLLS